MGDGHRKIGAEPHPWRARSSWALGATVLLRILRCDEVISSGGDVSQSKTMSAPTAKGPMRLDRVSGIIETKLEQEPMIVDTLVAAAAKGNLPNELWDQLHRAAVRDSRINELSSAYEQFLGGTRVKLLAPGVQADVLCQAAGFFDEFLGDSDRAEEYWNRALAAVPGHLAAFARLEAKLANRNDAEALVKLYVS